MAFPFLSYRIRGFIRRITGVQRDGSTIARACQANY
jgi:hypothetical protein